MTKIPQSQPSLASPSPWERVDLAANDRPVQENFSRWFGDSKVLGEDGKPLVVYHSTFGAFDAFDQSKDIGYHFGSAVMANNRTAEALKSRGRGQARHDGLNLMPVFLSIQRPFHMPKDPVAWEPQYTLEIIGQHVPEQVKKHILEMDDECVEKARAERSEIIAEGGPGVRKSTQPWVGGKTFFDLKAWAWADLLAKHRVEVYAAIRKTLGVAGFDGLSYFNEIEGAGRTKAIRSKNPENLTWVAFEPAQIKSALGNCGLYLPQSISITDQVTGQGLRAATWAQAHLAAEAVKKEVLPMLDAVKRKATSKNRLRP